MSARYSPNGAEIAYLSPEGLVVAAADGSQARVLVPGRLQDFQGWPSSLAWSPTGDRIAFVAKGRSDWTNVGLSGVLAVVDVASAGVVPLADVGGINMLRSLKFSPEGDQILFARRDASRATSVWSVRDDGSDPHRLVAGTAWGDWQTLIPTR